MTQAERPQVSPRLDRQRIMVAVGFFVIASVGLVTWASGLNSGFFTDDYVYLDWLGRLAPAEYFSRSFDPRQIIFYRPMLLVMLFGEYALFRYEATYYHLVQTLLHLSNSFLLLGIVWRLSKQWRFALSAALLYVGFPVYSTAVLWISVHDPLAVCFFLLTVCFWISYLQTALQSRYYLALIGVVLTLLSKEIVGIALPIALFLIDRWFIRGARDRRTLLWNYVPMFLLLGAHLGISYYVSASNLYIREGLYSIGGHLFTNLIDYLSMLAFPWGLPAPLNYAWVAIVLLVFVLVMVAKRSTALFFIAIMIVLCIAPLIASSLGTNGRYLYIVFMATALVLARLIEFGRSLGQSHGLRISASVVLAIFVIWNGWGVNEAADIFSGIARARRVPFRDIMREHPTFPEDTLLYFVEPPYASEIPHVAAMFYQRYGAKVSVDGTDVDGRPNIVGRHFNNPARLRDYSQAFVYYFDAVPRAIEVPVDKSAAIDTSLQFPINFQVPMRLEGLEVTSSYLKQGESFVVLLYWRAMGMIEKDYTVFVHILDPEGQIVDGIDGKPRDGKEHTSSWILNQFTVDGRVIPIGTNFAAGKEYQLEIGLYFEPTMERVGIVDELDRVITDRLVIGTFSVSQ